LGHQAILKQLKAIARDRALDPTVITFEPQPQEYFQPERAPARLTRWREKFELLEVQGMAQMICLRFDAALASLSAKAFVEQVLVRGLNVKCLVAGDDFRFGKGREGDQALLKALGAEYGFQVVRAQTHRLNGRRVSSTWVREVLAAGEMERARRLLGRYYSISGRVVHGDKQGHRLGFATANIDLRRGQSPVQGIFAARVFELAAEGLAAVTYVGSRSAVGGKRRVLEAHVFDFEQDCYGAHVRVELIKKLRDDQHFDSFEALKRQIALDAECARSVLAKRRRLSTDRV
jgi:riboflavin kinase/FMN adenylyltransferase